MRIVRRIFTVLGRRVAIAIHRPRHRRELEASRIRTSAQIDRIAAETRRAGRRPLVLAGIHQHLGDVIMATAVVRHLRYERPDAVLLFATQPRYRDVMAHAAQVDHVIDCSCVGSLLALAAHPAFDQVHLLTLDGDCCELCGAVFRETYPPYVAGGIGYANWFRRGRHLVDLWLERVGGRDADRTPELHVPPAIRREMADRLQARLPGSGRTKIAIHTRTPHWPAKEWPRPNFLALMPLLQAELGADVIAIGTEPVAPLPEGVIDLTGSTSLLEMAAVLLEVDLFIGLDSGPAHVASAVGTPSIVLFGPTDPAMCRPRGEHVVTLWHGAEADGLFAMRARDGANRDMAKIGVGEVLEAARRLMPARAMARQDG
jgi:heptosyltransferase-3